MLTVDSASNQIVANHSRRQAIQTIQQNEDFTQMIPQAFKTNYWENSEQIYNTGGI